MASLKGNIIWNALRVISNMLFPLVTFPYASRVLGPEGIGLYNYVFAIASYFTLFASFGFSLYGTREIAVLKGNKESLNETTNSIMTGNLLITLVVVAFYFLFCLFCVHDNKSLFFVVGFLIILTPISFEWFYQGMEDFKYLTIRGIVIKSISLVFLFIFVKTPSDLLLYAILCVAATCGNNLLNLFRLKKYIKIRLVFDNLGKHLKGASVFFLGTVAISLYSYMNDIIVGLLDNMEGVGYFSTGNKLIHIILTVLGVVTISIMPRMSSLVGKGCQEEAEILIKKTLNLIMYLAIPITIGIFVMAKPIVSLFAGVKFLPSVGVVKILSFLIIIISLSQFWGNQVLIPNRQEKYCNYSVIIGAIVNIGLALILVPRMSFYGVAVSLLLAETTVTFVIGYFANKIIKLRICNYLPFKPIVSAIVMGVSIMLLEFLSSSWIMTFSSIILGATIYIGCLYILNDKFAKTELLSIVYRKIKYKP